jgi:hypothetical protein
MNSDVSKSSAGPIMRLDPCWPVLPGPRYRGLVWNHPSAKDGTLITTSAVIELKDGRIVTRSGSAYELGRTYYSEQHAAAHGALEPETEKSKPAQPLQVIDLENDDPSVLATFIHERLLDPDR